MTESKDAVACCQSCGIPFNEEHRAKGLIALKEDGTYEDYCTLCYKDGSFTQPDMTMQEMIDLAIEAITPQFGAEMAKKMTEELIPTLRRWRQ